MSSRNSRRQVNNYFIPGYSGYCPQYLFRSVGQTYANATRQIMVDMPYVSNRLSGAAKFEEAAFDEDVRDQQSSSKRVPEEQANVGDDEQDEKDETRGDKKQRRRKKKKRAKAAKFGQDGSAIPGGIPDMPWETPKDKNGVPLKLLQYEKRVYKVASDDSTRMSRRGGSDEARYVDKTAPGVARYNPKYCETYIVHKWFDDAPDEDEEQPMMAKEKRKKERAKPVEKPLVAPTTPKAYAEPVPGYGGYIPGYVFCVGQTFGNTCRGLRAGQAPKTLPENGLTRIKIDKRNGNGNNGKK